MSSARPVIVTDIEGTTTPIRFVTETLFPFARARIGDFLRARPAHPQIAATRDLANEPEADLDRVIALLIGWIDADRKATPLKALQGEIWRLGYESGALISPVYPDAAIALRRWHAAGHRLYCYSSGSVEAQILLFRHSDQGDLAHLFSGWFDTTLGPKTEPDSYRRLAEQIGVPAADLLFLSDNERELDAAAECGWRVGQVLRAGVVPSARHAVHADFANVAAV